MGERNEAREARRANNFAPSWESLTPYGGGSGEGSGAERPFHYLSFSSSYSSFSFLSLPPSLLLLVFPLNPILIPIITIILIASLSLSPS